MATSKVVEAPKVLTVNVEKKATSIDIKTPLGLHVVAQFDNEGWCEDLEITSINSKKPKYTCTSVPEMLQDVLDYTTPQFEELVSIARELRKAHEAAKHK